MRAKHLVKGNEAERRARRYLEHRGLAFVEANYRCPPGEIDLVMRDGAQLVFVEVRYRKDLRYGGALHSIDHRKQRKMRQAAAHYLQCRFRSEGAPCRFDVVLVTGPAIDNAQVEWIANAL